MRIYIADLAAYNAGKYHGTWIEITPGTTVQDVEEEGRAMLAKSPVIGAEEWDIHDTEDVPGDLWKQGVDYLCRLADAVEEHGPVAEALACYCPDDLDYLETATVVGPEKSRNDAAMACLEAMGQLDALESLHLGFLARGFKASHVIDWEAVAECLECNDGWTFTRHNGQFYAWQY